MELNHFSHPHPLLLVEDKSDQVREAYYCSGCGELIQDSSYRCADCEFFLHKTCAELPGELDHPFHPQHPLVLYDKPQYDFPRVAFECNSCGKEKGEGFVYHCSTCKFDLDIHCALLPKFIVGDFPKLKHFSHQHSLLFIEKHYPEGADQSFFACEDLISGPIYCCFDCQVFLHKKCAELPGVINHPSHRKHSLTLGPSPPPSSHSKHSLALLANYPHEKGCSCHLCSKLQKGFVYYCSPCEFSISIKYIFSHLFEAKIHEHPFTLLSRPMSFICDACGICGEYCMPYICTICNLVVHKDCISLPHTIKLRKHEHSIFHVYNFLKENEVRKRICRICRKDVSMEYGSYHCLDCDDYFVHVNCAREKDLWDNEIFEEEVNQKSSETLGEGKIKHFSHDHKLLLSDEMKNCEYYCDGCRRSISTAFYHCAECNYLLHKCCAELPRKKKHWTAEKIRTLNFEHIFWCYFCGFYCSGFCYVNDDDRAPIICIGCFEIPDYYLAHGHDHHLFFDHKLIRECSVCNEKYGKFRCEDNCEFVLCRRCIALPETAWYKHDEYKHDEHPLALTYYDDVQWFCDICEEPRDPKKWFYYCATCDYSCHSPCALGKYPYVKLGSPANFATHEHPLTFMKDNLRYHKCSKCGKSCKDAFLKCVESECKYVVHYLCQSFLLQIYRRWL
ncbi:hypothetical protein SLEP1_g25957 [Rubroshorea leprosula]|uniref:Phorbol-ester/DAG-type domain-containing protein n=1 Tax=Rubroshorea leprosula TaxID=152421 RepID=A0AAV5JSQ7_9ROSI|nr:hypothetical protein SLEP1_g25957 [Rubroshorea leprosula]